MNLYRAVGLQELGLIYDSGMKAFPVGLPQQPVFYPVLHLEYARQIASDWNIKNGDFAGYVTKFSIDDQYINRFEMHAVGDSSYQEFWIQAEEVGKFNKHIVGHIKALEAYFGDAFQGFIPDKFGLQGKNAVEQFSLLTTIYIYKRMDFFLEVRRNHKAIFLNYPFWQKHNFKNSGSKEKILKAIREAWLTSFPMIPLVNYVQQESTPLEETESSNEPVQDDDSFFESNDTEALEDPIQEDRKSINYPKPVSLERHEQRESKPVSQTNANLPVKPVYEKPKPIEKPVSHFEEGVKLGLAGRYQEAVGELSKATESDPDHAAAYTSLGVAYHRLNEDDRALSCYESALKINGSYADAHYFKANVLYTRGNTREAVVEYTIAMGLEPELIDAHQKPAPQDRLTDYTSLPAELYRIDRIARRILSLNKLIETNPRRAELFKERAAEYYRLWNYEQAISDYSSSLASQPKDANVLHLRGQAYEQIGQHERARQDYEQAIAINPQLTDTYINRGIEFAKAGNFRQAIASLTDAVRLAPKNPDIYFNRGMSHFQSGDLESAISDFSKVIQLSPGDEDAYYWRGVSNEDVGRRQDARTDYLRFLELSQNMQAREEIEQRLKQWNEGDQNVKDNRKDIPADMQVKPEKPERDLYALVIALGERARTSNWFGSGVECSGETAEELLSLINQNQLIRGQDFLRLVFGIHQIAEGDFIALDPGSSTHWILIRAWQGIGFYIEINDPRGSERLKYRFQSVEEVDGGDPSYESLFIHI